MKNIYNITSAIILLVSVALSSSSCKRVDTSVVDGRGPIELEFFGTVSAVADAAMTKATPEKLPVGTEVRVEVYTANSLAAGSTDVLQQGTYIVLKDDGVMYPKTPDDRLMVAKGSYDFRLLTPVYKAAADKSIELKVNESLLGCLIANKLIDVDNRLLSATFERLNARLDVVIKAKDKSFVKSLATSTDTRKAVIGNLPVSGKLTGSNAYVAASDDRTGSVSFDTKMFVAAGTFLTSTLSTVADPIGAAIIAVTDYTGTTAANLKLSFGMPLLINGMERYVQIEMPTGFHVKAGYKYIVEIAVDIAGEPEYTIKVEPWLPGGSSTNDAPRGGHKVGDYLHNGELVFWVDPFEKERHYKTIFIDANPLLNYAEAVKYCDDAVGGEWRLPKKDECVEITKNILIFNNTLATVNGLPGASFGDFAGHTATDATGKFKVLYNLKSGIETASTSAAEKFYSYRVKEYGTGAPASLDYTLQPANCYVSYPAAVGEVMQPILFNATQKPRSLSSAVGHRGYINNVESGTDASVVYQGGVYTGGAMNTKQLEVDLDKSMISKIEVVWQTMFDHGKKVDLSDGSVDFTKYNAVTEGTAFIKKIAYDNTTGNATVTMSGTGNALIAAYDAGGTILWSWHIWGTETPPQANVAPSDLTVNGAGKMFMDRNLGALAATTVKPTVEDAYKYFGTLYQWGRKEPFTGNGPQNVITTPTAIFNKDGLWMQSKDETSNTKPAQNTKGGYTYSNTYASSTYTLLINPTTHYYGGDTGNVIIDNPNTWTPYSNTVTKSIYDPCPYGYRVPKVGSWDNLPTSGNTKWTLNSMDGGQVLLGSWWPACGGRDVRSASLSYVGAYGLYWSSSSVPDWLTYRYQLYIDNDGGLRESYYNSPSDGESVRCVEEAY